MNVFGISKNHRVDRKQRDDAIRILTYTPVKKREGLPYELFDSYWRDVHGPLCSRLPGLGFYVRHHFSRELHTNLWPQHHDIAELNADYDGAVEIGFENSKNQALFTKAGPLLFSDEQNFIGADNAYDLPKGSRTFVDYEEEAYPNGPDRYHRLHAYFSRRTALNDFRETLTRFAESVANDDSITKMRLHLPEPYDNSNPQPPAPRVNHLLPADRTEIGILEISFATAS